MSSSIFNAHLTAPTPQNTPLTHAPISVRLSRPTVPDISEEPEVGNELSALGVDGMQSAMLGMVQGKLAPRPSRTRKSLPARRNRSRTTRTASRSHPPPRMQMPPPPTASPSSGSPRCVTVPAWPSSS
ncbi:hypothetical protein C8J57DRAFT_724109 [Mycena rebaudengoi]|nr:hypothetical protein C8J57DRAFT_724109 [Mycena rebaudengoi]